MLATISLSVAAARPSHLIANDLKLAERGFSGRPYRQEQCQAGDC